MTNENEKEDTRTNEAGSAILWVLMAVGLFAALNFAFNSGSRVSTSNLSDSEATAYANQIIQYGNEVKSSIKRLQLRGCSDTEISFENDVVAGYTNANSPTDKSCHIFDIAGGGLSWKIFDQSNIMEIGFNPSFANYYFIGSDAINDVGSDCTDASCTELLLTAFGLKKEICLKINTILDIQNPSNTPPADDMTANPLFTGSYSYNATYIIGDTTTELDGFKTGCFDDTDCTNCYSYYNALITR